MSRFRECDTCGPTDAVIYEIATRRPSDPMSLCCILTACSGCTTPDVITPDVVPSIGTYDDLATWVEDHGHKHGIAFYE